MHLGQRLDDRLAPLSKHLHGAVGIVNLEGPVGDGDSRRERLFNAADALPALAKHGVAVASVVNNHTLDQGPDGLIRTRDAMRRAGISPAGALVPATGRAARQRPSICH